MNEFHELDELIDRYREQEPFPLHEAEARSWSRVLQRTAVNPPVAAKVASVGLPKIFLGVLMATAAVGGAAMLHATDPDDAPKAAVAQSTVTRVRHDDKSKHAQPEAERPASAPTADLGKVPHMGTVDGDEPSIGADQATRSAAAEAPEPSPRSTLKSNRKTQSSSRPASDLGEETRILRRAQKSLESGDHAGARRSLRLHKSRFQRGELRELRELLTISLACSENKTRRAAKLLSSFERDHPHSLLQNRARQACATAEESDTRAPTNE